jgi:hypothetical protein
VSGSAAAGATVGNLQRHPLTARKQKARKQKPRRIFRRGFVMAFRLAEGSGCSGSRRMVPLSNSTAAAPKTVTAIMKNGV